MSEELERLWSSSDPGTLVNFYRKAATLERMTSFSRNRPAAEIGCKVIDRRDMNSKEGKVVFVVPTTGDNAIMDRFSNYFKKSSIVFSVSNGQYFNFSRSLNEGVRKARELDPEWIILANDDIQPEESESILTEHITKLGSGAYTVFKESSVGLRSDRIFGIFRNSKAMSIPHAAGVMRYALTGGHPIQGVRRIGVMLRILPLYNSLSEYVNYTGWRFDLGTRIRKSAIKATNFQDFGIFSGDLIDDLTFDETFINDDEDFDLTLQLLQKGIPIKPVEFRLRKVRTSSSLGTGIKRYAHAFFNRMYLSHKISGEYASLLVE